MKKLLLFLMIIIMILPAVRAEDGKLNIVCTSFPCYDLARAVAGDTADVSMLIKPGTEVHSYDPSPSDIIMIASCDLFIYIGGESDAWVDNMLNSFGNESPEVLRLFDCVEALNEEEVEGMTVHETADEDGEYDEHIWTDPRNAVKMTGMIAAGLSGIDPANAEKYSENARGYIEQINDLDEQIREIVTAGKRREIVVADRFPFLYFAKAYGLDYSAAFPSCSSESEPSANTMSYLIDRVREREIPVIYVLELSSKRVAESVSEETGAEIMTLYSIQNISYDDFMNGENYVTLMERNITALRKGLN